MSRDFESPILEAAAEQLEQFGYEYVHTEEGYDVQGRLVHLKVYQCLRNNLQVVLQTTKLVSIIETNVNTGD